MEGWGGEGGAGGPGVGGICISFWQELGVMIKKIVGSARVSWVKNGINWRDGKIRLMVHEWKKQIRRKPSRSNVA